MRYLPFVLILAWSLIGRHLAAAEFSGSIPAELTTAAKDILQVLESQKQQQIEVGQFVPVGNSRANGGPGLRLELVQALETQRKGVVQDKALVAVQGKFLTVDDPAERDVAESQRLIAERLTLELIDKSTGDTINSKSIFIRRLRDIVQIEGATAKVDPDADARKQNQEVKQRIKDPTVFVDGTRIRSKKESPFALELAVKPVASPDSSGKTQTPTIDQGQAFVPIDQGQLYELVFHNSSQSEVAVSVKIDGIDLFAFSDDKDPKTGKPQFSHFIVAAGGKLLLPGWHKTNDPNRKDNFQRFLVTEYGKGAASKFPEQSQGSVGVITLQVAFSYPGDLPSKSGAETGFGPPVKAELKPVERKFDPPHDFISVRYLR